MVGIPDPVCAELGTPVKTEGISEPACNIRGNCRQTAPSSPSLPSQSRQASTRPKPPRQSRALPSPPKNRLPKSLGTIPRTADSGSARKCPAKLLLRHPIALSCPQTSPFPNRVGPAKKSKPRKQLTRIPAPFSKMTARRKATIHAGKQSGTPLPQARTPVTPQNKRRFDAFSKN